MLYHISDDPRITRFDPRPAAGVDHPVVWAIDADRLRNYLLPRDCPRVTFYAGAPTSPADAERFLGGSAVVVAVESAWLGRVRSARLFKYAFDDLGFESVDKNAGYFHSRESVTPLSVETIDDVLSALLATGVELRILPTLWQLHDAVITSTLSYSMIRMRNAGPREMQPE